MNAKETSGKKKVSADTLYWKVFVAETPVAAVVPVNVAVVSPEATVGRPERT
jgi:hypothetical protein